MNNPINKTAALSTQITSIVLYICIFLRLLNQALNQFVCYISSPWLGIELMADCDLVTGGHHDSSSYTWLSGAPQVCQNGGMNTKFQIPTLTVQLGLKGG